MPRKNTFESLYSMGQLNNDLSNDSKSYNAEKLHDIATDYVASSSSIKQTDTAQHAIQKLYSHPNLASHTIEMLHGAEQKELNESGRENVNPNHTRLVSHPNTPQHIAQQFLSDNYSKLSSQHSTQEIDKISAKANLPEEEKIRIEKESLDNHPEERFANNEKNLKLNPSFYENMLLSGDTHWHATSRKAERLIHAITSHPEHTPESLVSAIDTLNKFKDKSINDGYWVGNAENELHRSLQKLFSHQKDKLDARHLDKMFSLVDETSEMAGSILDHPNTNENTVLRIVNDKTNFLKEKALASPALKPETLSGILKSKMDSFTESSDDSNAFDIEAIAKNPSLPSDQLDSLLKFSSEHFTVEKGFRRVSSEIRKSVLSNKNATPDQIDQALETLSDYDLTRVIQTQKLSPDIMKKVLDKGTAETSLHWVNEVLYKGSQNRDENLALTAYDKINSSQFSTLHDQKAQISLLDNFSTVREKYLVQAVDNIKHNSLIGLIPLCTEQTQKEAYTKLGERLIKENSETDWNVSGSFLDLYDTGAFNSVAYVWKSNAPQEIKDTLKNTINKKLNDYINSPNRTALGSKLFSSTIHFANSNDEDSVDIIKKSISDTRLSAGSLSEMISKIENPDLLNHVVGGRIIPHFNNLFDAEKERLSEALLKKENISPSAANSCVQLLVNSPRLTDAYLDELSSYEDKKLGKTFAKRFLTITKGNDEYLVNAITSNTNRVQLPYHRLLGEMLDVPEEIYSNDKKQNLISKMLEANQPMKLPLPEKVVQYPTIAGKVLDQLSNQEGSGHKRYASDLIQAMSESSNAEQYLPKIADAIRLNRSLLNTLPYHFTTKDEILNIALDPQHAYSIDDERIASMLLTQKYIKRSFSEKDSQVDFQTAVNKLTDLFNAKYLDLPFFEDGEEESIKLANKVKAYDNILRDIRDIAWNDDEKIQINPDDFNDIKTHIANSGEGIETLNRLIRHKLVDDSVEDFIATTPEILVDILTQGGHSTSLGWSDYYVNKYSNKYIDYIKGGGTKGVPLIHSLIDDGSWSKLDRLFSADSSGETFNAIVKVLGMKDGLKALKKSLPKLSLEQSHQALSKLFKGEGNDKKELLKNLHIAFEVANGISQKSDISFNDEISNSVSNIKKSIVEYAQGLKSNTLLKSITNRLLAEGERGGVELALKSLSLKEDLKLISNLSQYYPAHIQNMSVDEINSANNKLMDLFQNSANKKSFGKSIHEGLLVGTSKRNFQKVPVSDRQIDGLLSLASSVKANIDPNDYDSQYLLNTLHNFALENAKSVKKYEEILDNHPITILPCIEHEEREFIKNNPKIYRKYLDNLFSRDGEATSELHEYQLKIQFQNLSDDIRKYLYERVDQNLRNHFDGLILSHKLKEFEPVKHEELVTMAMNSRFGGDIDNITFDDIPTNVALKAFTFIKSKLNDTNIPSDKRYDLAKRVFKGITPRFLSNNSQREDANKLILESCNQMLKLGASKSPDTYQDIIAHARDLATHAPESQNVDGWVDFYSNLIHNMKSEGLFSPDGYSLKDLEISRFVTNIPKEKIDMKLVDKMIRWSYEPEKFSAMSYEDRKFQGLYEKSSYILGLATIPEDAFQYIDFDSPTFIDNDLASGDSVGFHHFLTILQRCQHKDKSRKVVDLVEAQLNKDIGKLHDYDYRELAITLSNNPHADKIWREIENSIDDTASGDLEKAVNCLSFMAENGIAGIKPLDAILEKYRQAPQSHVKIVFSREAIKRILESPKINKYFIENMPELLDNEYSARTLFKNTNVESDAIEYAIDRHFPDRSVSDMGDDISKILFAHPNISESTFKMMYAQTAQQKKADFHSGSQFHPALFNPTFGRKLFGELSVELPKNLKGLNPKKGIIPEFVVEPKQIKQLKSILPHITDKIDFKTLKGIFPESDKMDAVKDLFRKSHYITPEDVAKAMEQYKSSKYHITYTYWNGMQRHSKENNLVIQLNTSESQAQKLAEDPKLWAFYQFVQKSANAQDPTNPNVGLHPNTPHSVSWIRVDTSAGNEWIVEEFQSDFSVNLHKAIAELESKFPNGFERDGHHYTIEECHSFADNIIDIIGDWDIASMSGIEELAKLHEVKNLYIHGVGLRAAMSGLSQKEEGSSKLEKLYFKNPKDFKYQEVSPDEYPNKTIVHSDMVIQKNNQLFMPYKGMKIPYKNWKKKIA